MATLRAEPTIAATVPFQMFPLFATINRRSPDDTGSSEWRPTVAAAPISNVTERARLACKGYPVPYGGNAALSRRFG